MASPDRGGFYPSFSRPLRVLVLAGMPISGCARVARPNLPIAVPPIGTRVSASGTFTILHANDIHGDLQEFVVDTGHATAQTGDPGPSQSIIPRGTRKGGASAGAR